MSKELISVIVPCYNVSRYISKCLDSILNQTYKYLEIILVDDCSTDNTFEILEEYSKKDNRIVLIKNDKNMGLSFSRNIGIKRAKGKYLGFVDSDDYVSDNFYEKLFEQVNKYNCDIAISDMKVVYYETGQEIVGKCYFGEYFNLLNVINTGLAASACNKLFKRELITKYLFAEGKVNEDIAVVIPILAKSNKIGYAQNTYYHYIQRDNSIQNGSFSDKRFDIFDGINTTLKRIEGNRYYEEIKNILIFQQIINMFLYVIPREKNLIKRRRVLKTFNKRSLKYDIRKNPYFWNFLRLSGSKHRLYYKLLLKFNCIGFYDISNFMIFAYDVLYKCLKKSVIKKDISLDDIIKAARHQSKLKAEKITVSAVIPNYNYARFLRERVYSILNQTFKIHELIILDDKSSDNSVEEIDKIVNAIRKYVNVKSFYNKSNSGSPFKQWGKGFKESKGQYVWIAEADDYCKKNMLKELVKPLIKNKHCVISYCDTAFIDFKGRIITSSIKSEIDVQRTGHWSKSYNNNGKNEINNYSFLNNTIANVSSCLIKKGNYEDILKEAGKYRQAGDWLFYVMLMSNGDISYIDMPLNYYRQDGSNVSSTTNYQKHLDEIKSIYKYFERRFKLNDIQKNKMKERILFLKKAWKLKYEVL